MSTTPNLPPRKELTSLKKGPTLFMKPKGIVKKKFQMDAPDAAETEKFDRLVV